MIYFKRVFELSWLSFHWSRWKMLVRSVPLLQLCMVCFGLRGGNGQQQGDRGWRITPVLLQVSCLTFSQRVFQGAINKPRKTKLRPSCCSCLLVICLGHSVPPCVQQCLTWQKLWQKNGHSNTSRATLYRCKWEIKFRELPKYILSGNRISDALYYTPYGSRVFIFKLLSYYQHVKISKVYEII